MDEQTDPDFLANEAYDDAGQLDSRQRIQDRFGTHPQAWFRWCFERLDLPPRARLLDLGSGSGELWAQNLDRLPADWQITLGDLSSGMLLDAWHRLSPSSDRKLGDLSIAGKYPAVQLDAEALPFTSRRFQAVLALGLLDHLPGSHSALAEMRRTLDRGGRLFVSAGGQSHLQELDELLRPFLDDPGLGGDPDRFGLENGAEILQSYFAAVDLYSYRAEMLFRRAEPVLIYILSEPAVRRSLYGFKCEALRQRLLERLHTGGPIRVTLEKGLFVAG